MNFSVFSGAFSIGSGVAAMVSGVVIDDGLLSLLGVLALFLGALSLSMADRGKP